MCNHLFLFDQVLTLYENPEKWDNKRFSKIKTISNTKVGNVGQCFIEKLCLELNFPYSFPMDQTGKRLNQSPWDIKIKELTFELKTATEDTNNNFQFNHIRYHREYQALICLGVSPDNLYFNIWSKSDVLIGKAGKLVSMEKSANASYKLTKTSKNLHPIAEFKLRIEAFAQSFCK